MNPEKFYKTQLEKHLFGGEAFISLDEMLNKIPFHQLKVRPAGLPYSFFEQFYHLWYTQRDILNYCLKPDYSAPNWPQDYWPKEQSPSDAEAWSRLKNAFFGDREKLRELIASDAINLFDRVPSHQEHTIFREVLLVVEHSAYHTGQLLIILRLLGLK